MIDAGFMKTVVNASRTNFNGLMVIGHNCLPKTSTQPVKSHMRNPRREAYHTRIQKKWTKRFGTREELYFVITGGAVYAHPDNIEVLKTQIQAHLAAK